MKPKHLCILLLCAVFWTMGIAAFVYTTYKLEQVIPYKAKFGVSEKQVGLSTSTDQLDLGVAPRGGSGRRHVYVENTQAETKRFTFVVEGDIAKFVQVNPQSFVLKPREAKTVDIIGIAPPDSQIGTFEGTIAILIEQP